MIGCPICGGINPTCPHCGNFNTTTHNRFNLDRLTDDLSSGSIKSAEVFWDRSHNDKPDHIDLHVTFNDQVGKKYSGLSGTDDLKRDFPWMKPGDKYIL